MSAKVAEIFETMEYGPAPESDKTAKEWLESHGRSFGHFIDGKWVKPNKTKSFTTKNPATGEIIAKIAALEGAVLLSVVSRVELEGGVYRDPDQAHLRRPRLDAILEILPIPSSR